jgi:hypothetical protein
MTGHLRARLPYLLSFLVVAAACVGSAQARSAFPARDGTVAPGRPSLTIQSPTPGEVVEGVTVIRFLVENISIASPFLPTEKRDGRFPAGHLHVTVDGAPWHWVHATSDPVVLTPLPPGEHVVALELAGADHRPLDAHSVRFTVVAKATTAMVHAEHR